MIERTKILLLSCFYVAYGSSEIIVKATIHITNNNQDQDLLVLTDGYLSDWTYLHETVPRSESVTFSTKFSSAGDRSYHPIPYRLQWANGKKYESTYLSLSAFLDPKTLELSTAHCTAWGNGNTCSYTLHKDLNEIEFNVQIN